MDQLPPDATAPSSSRPDDIRSSLHDTWKEIEAVKEQIKRTLKEIERANASLEGLQALETELLDTAKVKAWALSPFKRLPRDNISEIVGHVTSPSIILGGVDRSSIWSMTHVCSSWRQMILSLSHLWSSFSIYGKVPLEMVLAVLERSGSHPLSFVLNTSPEITSILVKHSERWKDADIDLSAGSAIFLGLRNRLPLLENLKLTITFMRLERGWTDSEEEQSIFEYAPSLSKLDLIGFSSDFPVQFRFPTEQLVHYLSNWYPDVDSMGVCHWQLEDLSNFNKLSRLFLFNLDPQLELRSSSRMSIELPRVSQLRLDNSLELLAIIVLPSLTDLDVRDLEVNQGSFFILQTFLSSIPRNQLNTFSLITSSNENASHCIRDLLAHPGLQHIHTLSLEQGVGALWTQSASPWVKSLLDRSTFYIPKQPLSGTEPHILLPNLRNFSLSYNYQNEDGAVLDALLDFVFSRTSFIDRLEDADQHGNLVVPPRLEAVYFRYSDFLEPITMENFHHFEEGLVRLCPSWWIADE